MMGHPGSVTVTLIASASMTKGTPSRGRCQPRGHPKTDSVGAKSSNKGTPLHNSVSFDILTKF